MEIFHAKQDIKVKGIQPTVVALGNFDGVHPGHAELISRTAAYARTHGLRSAVFTFSNHPQNVIAGREVVKNIISPEEKLVLIRSLDVDYLFSLPFDESFHSMPPEAFVRDLLLETFNAKAVSCGFNYHFGKDASGNTVSLEESARREGFHMEVMEPFILDGTLVSSTLIRGLISEGKVDRCAKYMGRPFTIGGEVIHGKGLGRNLGFPTANVATDPHLISLAHGVYVTNTEVNGKIYPSVTNVGMRPTVGGDMELAESHILGFDADIYGEHIRTTFLEKLRDERKFADIESLTAQIMKDKETACAKNQRS
jgi:riboflavin kinase/FMN adenylyltransferase